MKTTEQRAPTGVVWERQPGESAKVFGYFARYRDLPAKERTVQRVAELLSLNPATLRVIAYRWAWTRRATAWDDHVDRQRREAELAEITEMSKRQARHAASFQSALVIPLTALTKKLRDDHGQLSTRHFEEMEIGELFDAVLDAARAFSTVARVERLARGEPTENQHVTGGIRFMAPVVVKPSEQPADDSTIEDPTEINGRDGTDDRDGEEP